MACSALISLLDTQHSRQGNWWLPDGGFPQHLASPDAPAASYRYLLCLDRRGSRISCWRRYPEGLGWQRRCGPMPLAQFIRRFQQPGAARRASS